MSLSNSKFLYGLFAVFILTLQSAIAVSQSFTISASYKRLDGTEFPASISLDRPDGLRSLLIVCSKENPVSKGETVTCYPTAFGKQSGEGDFMYWSGDCSRREGLNCIIDNIENNKHLILHVGYQGNATSEPYRAGSLWCESGRGIGGIWNIDYARSYCEVQTNPGYTFDRMVSDSTVDRDSIFHGVTIGFIKKDDKPSVLCGGCTVYSTTVGNSTTDTALITSREDDQLVSTQAIASITTNIETEEIGTDIRVNTQKLAEISRGGRVMTNNTNVIANLLSSNSATLVSSNSEDQSITSAQVTPYGATIHTAGVLNPIAIVSLSGQTVVIENRIGLWTPPLTKISLSALSGEPLGAASISLQENIVEVPSGNSVSVLGGVSTQTTFASASAATVIATLANPDELTIKVDIGASMRASIQGLSAKADSALTVTSNYGSLMIAEGGSYNIWNNTFNNSEQIVRLVHTQFNAPRVAVSLIDNVLKAVDVYSEASGKVEVFKPEANGPILTNVDVNDESLDMILTFPAVQ